MSWIGEAVVGIVAGMAGGALFFLTLAQVAARYAAGRSLWTVGLHAFRLLAMAGIFYMLARTGAVALLAGLGGFLLARLAIMTRQRRRAM